MIFCLLFLFQISCRAKGVFHVTVPTPPKVSIFKSAADSMPAVSVMEDTTDSQSFIISLPPEALQQKNSEGVVQKRCVEILALTSSDETMVFSSSITITDVAGGCQVSFSLNANASGDLKFIAISIADPTDQFFIPITIKAINDPPVIAGISPVVLGEDAQTAIPINIVDDTPGLTCADMISTTSSNETLLPNLNISVSGTIPNCQINYLPALNQTGSSTITLSVSDGSLTAFDTFVLTVNPVNDPPTTLSISNLNLAENADTNAVVGNLSATDPDTGDTFIYSLAAGTGSTDNSSFNILGSQLRLTASADFETKSSYSILLRATDQGGLFFEKQFTITITNVNEAPTNLALSSLSLAENSGSNAVVGNLSATDPDASNTFTYSLVAGTGSTDNGSFNILGSQLRLTASADFEIKSSYSILLRATDQGGLFFEKQFTITITNVNEAPTNLALSSLSLAENSGSNAVVGNLSATDPDASNTFTYSLVAGTGSTDNGSFNILGSQLRMTASADFETKSAYSILIRATDQGGLYFEKQLTITITDVNESPNLAPIADQTTSEDTSKSILLTPSVSNGSLSCAGTNLLYISSDPTVVASTGAIIWSGSWPNCSALITPVSNASGSSSISISVSDGTLTATQTFNLTVTAVNDPPLISDTVNQTATEDLALAFGFVSIIDLETSLSCSVVVPTSSNSILIPSGNITFSGTAPNCLINMVPAPNQYGTSTITLTISDGSLTASDSFVLTVNPVNDPPTDLSISNANLPENAGANSVVGNLSTTDPDTGDTFIYSLAAGAGSTDNASFNILGNRLRMTASADFETKPSYSILLRATDQGGLFFEKQLTITISDVNETPSLSAIGNQTTNQDIPTVPIALTITDVDGPTGICNSSYLSYTSQTTSVVAANGAVSWSGTWPNCKAVITPVSGATGSSLISIIVSDGLLTSVPQSFTLQVGNVPNGWAQEAYIKASNANYSDFFGYSVAISGDTAVIGASGEDSNQTMITNGTTSSADDTATSAGASYIYKRTGAAWAQEAYLKASNANASDNFGISVAISGDTAVIGANGEDSNQTTITNAATSSADNTASDAGASYIYKRTGSTWAQEAYLKASNANAYDWFGKSVAISGDTAVIGANQEDSNQTTITNAATSSADNTASDAGASYIYKRTGSTWAQEAYLKASNANVLDKFGYSVAISGDTAVIGAWGEASNQTTITNGITSSADNSAAAAGASYIYKRTGAAWAQEAYLKASNANYSDWFGTSVAISGDTAVIGASGEDSNQTMITNGTTSSANNTAIDPGASYIYKRTGAAWAQEAYLKASNAKSNVNAYFGHSVAISGDTAVVGANQEASNQTTITNGTTSSSDDTATWAGASYIYKRTGTNWAQEAYLKASNANISDFYGSEVALSGDTAVIGTYMEDSNQTTITNGTTSSANNTANDAGAVYVYRNLSRMFEAYEIASSASSTSFSINWKGSNLGSANGNFKVVYSTTTPGANCSSGTVAYTGSVTSVSVNSGLTSGQSYIVRICSFDGTNYSEGITTQITVKGDDVGPTVLSITRGTTTNPVPLGTNLIDYIVTFNEPVMGVSLVNFSFTEVTTTTGATGEVSSVSCAGAVCTVWVNAGNTGQLRLDLSNTAGIGDNWGNPLTAAKTGDETFTLRGWHQEAYIKASNSNAYDWFGKSVAISGDTAVIGANAESSNQTTIINGTTSSAENSASGAGASYIYKRTGATWAQEAYLKASNANASDGFGNSVAISEDTAVIGAEWEASNQTTIINGTISSADNSAADAGASYIYKRTGTTWAQEAYLKASNANASDNFGNSVAISGDTAVIGAWGEASNQTTITNGTTSSADNTATNAGASYIYKRTGTSWAQEAYLKASNANYSDWFGTSVAISGDTAVIGAWGEASNQTTITNGITSSADNSAAAAGASYIYKRTGSTWAQEAYLKASNANAYDWFGKSVDISGDTAVVGANQEDSNQTTITNAATSSADNTASDAGASYIYKRTGSTWAQEAYLKASNANVLDKFGYSVAISGDTAVIGAWGEASNQTTITNGITSSADNSAAAAGASYIYKRTGAAWAQEAYLKASNANYSDWFGTSVAISGDTAVIGSVSESSNQTTITNGPTSSSDNSATVAGAVYVYRNITRLFDPDLRVSAKTTTSITLSWASSLGTTNRVKIAPAVSGTNNPLPCTDASAIALASGVESYTYSGLTTGTKYAFRVCGFDGTNVSEGAIIRDNTN